MLILTANPKLSNDWVQIGKKIVDGMDKKYTISVSINDCGNIIAIGAIKNFSTDTGHVRMYKYNNLSDDWIQIGNTVDGESSGDKSGISVSLNSSGEIVAIGAYLNDPNTQKADAGHVRMYKYNQKTKKWIQLGKDVDGESAGDLSGSVSLNSRGNIVAIGAPYNDGDDRGHVRVHKYNLISNQWEQIGQDIDGEAQFYRSGFAVNINGSGDTVIIGAPLNKEGRFRVYKYM